MKKLFILTVFSVLGLGFGHAKAVVIPDDGGFTSFTSEAPSNNGLRWRPAAGFPGTDTFSGSDRAYYDVGNVAGVYPYATNSFKIYMKENTRTVLTINNAGPNCHNWPGANGSGPGPDYSSNVGDGGPTTNFGIFRSSDGTYLQSASAPSAADCTFSRSFTINSSSGDIDTGDEAQKSGYTRYLFLIATIPHQSIQGENSFWLSSSSADAPLGFAGGSKIGMGFRATDLHNGNYWTSDTLVGLEQNCSNIGQNQKGVINYYDADAAARSSDGTAWNPSIQFDLQRRPNTSTGSWTTVFSRSYGYLAANNDGELYNGYFDPDYVYRVLLENVGVKNTVFLTYSNNLSQLASKYQLQQSDCTPPTSYKVSCTATASDATPDVGVGITITVVLKNASSSSGDIPSSYELRQTSPGGAAKTVGTGLSPGGQKPFTYTISARGSPQTVQFEYNLFDSSSASANKVGNPPDPLCSTPVTWGSPPNVVSCSAVPDDAKPTIGSADNITVTVTNNGNSNLQGDQLRQTNPSGGAWPATGFGNFTNGQTASHSFSISARTSAQTVTFEYNIFDGTTAGANNIKPPGPLCTATITWGNSSQPIHVAADCQNVTVSGGRSTATYQTATQPGSYQTTVPPSQWSLYPYPPGPPNAGANPFHLQTYTYTPPPQFGAAQTITKVPIKIEMDGNGLAETHYFWVDNSNSETKSFDTFNTWGGAWPHNSGYTVTVFFVASGNSQTYKDDGNYNTNPADYPDASWQRGDTASVPVCLDAGCGNPGSVDAEPGQRVKFVYGVHVFNQTQKTFSANDGNGYSFGVSTNGGISGVQSVNASPDLKPGTPTEITVSFTARIDYTGGWGTVMKFQGNPLTLSSLPGGSCGQGNTGTPGGATPYTRPFFEVRAGDLATGGCYQSASGSYNTASDPGYITPAPSNYSLNKSPDSGGIRAFSNPGGTRGSKAEFGVDALGQIFQDTSRFYGFYSASGVTFANMNTPNSYGGYLNSNAAAHCEMDFYDSTRTGSISNFSGGSISNLSTGQYQWNSGITITGGTVAEGTQVTIYVNGDVQIDGNITNASSWDATNPHDVPFLVIIAKGNISVGPGVTRLDGLFIAQPTGAGDSTTSGVFSSCYSYCPSQLVVNGGVIAQGIDLLRSHGTMGPLEADPNGVGQNAGEIFNYSPAMVIGLPYFVQNTTQLNILEGLFSLPPVF